MQFRRRYDGVCNWASLLGRACTKKGEEGRIEETTDYFSRVKRL